MKLNELADERKLEVNWPTIEQAIEAICFDKKINMKIHSKYV